VICCARSCFLRSATISSKYFRSRCVSVIYNSTSWISRKDGANCSHSRSRECKSARRDVTTVHHAGECLSFTLPNIDLQIAVGNRDYHHLSQIATKVPIGMYVCAFLEKNSKREKLRTKKISAADRPSFSADRKLPPLPLPETSGFANRSGITETCCEINSDRLGLN